MQTCSEPAGLGEVNDEELNRLDWELEKGFNEALKSEKDFMDGVRVGFLKNVTKLLFNLAGFVLNSREIQDMPDKLESSDVEDEGAYVGGKITADVVTTVLGIIGIVSGVGQVVTGLAGDVGGGALCASGVGIPAGVAVVAGSTTLVVAGAAEVAASASLVYSSVSNFGRDVDELKESKEKKETASPEKGANEAEISGEATVESADKSGNYSGADNVADAARLKEYYRQAEKYGTGSIKELENGRCRFYEKLKPARTQGEMAGARHVREWDPYTGQKRDWYETLDHSGNIRQVRQDPNLTEGIKVHHMFDADGKYIGSWTP